MNTEFTRIEAVSMSVGHIDGLCVKRGWSEDPSHRACVIIRLESYCAHIKSACYAVTENMINELQWSHQRVLEDVLVIKEIKVKLTRKVERFLIEAAQKHIQSLTNNA